MENKILQKDQEMVISPLQFEYDESKDWYYKKCAKLRDDLRHVAHVVNHGPNVLLERLLQSYYFEKIISHSHVFIFSHTGADISIEWNRRGKNTQIRIVIVYGGTVCFFSDINKLRKAELIAHLDDKDFYEKFTGFLKKYAEEPIR